ncbi:hypothetical protein LAUMK13_05789 [Mycobacterium innocens]|uniref:Uncharacterized protein n=1 Tax=Mycobacterium innocens TaxID=2341083 RepID=A0A498QN57_9MYCO|nr:hypothetical protein LAUMK13_05789 [Mycobacterium innocens]
MPVVGGLDELVDELGGGHVADPAALFAGGQAQSEEQVGLAGPGVAEQHQGLPGVDPGAAGQSGQLGGGDRWRCVGVELGESFEARELRFADAPGAAPVAAVVDFGGEDFGQETQMGLAFPHGDLGESGGFVADGG